MESENCDANKQLATRREYLDVSEHASDDVSDRYDEETTSNDKTQSRAFSCSSCTASKCSTPFILTGAVTCTTTQDQKIYCWHLVVDNCTGKSVKNVDLCLDVRSLQVDEPFTIGPGVFGPGMPPSATYSIQASDSVTGSVVATYDGEGTFYEATNLPAGGSSFVVCATFELPEPVLNFTQVLESPFSVKPRAQNYNSCLAPQLRSTTVFVKGGDVAPALLCPEFVEWDSNETTEPSNPCVDCAADGRIRFAIDTASGCVTHICRDETWTCISGTPLILQ